MPNNNEGIKTKVSVQGDKQYKDSLAQISRQLTVLNTDMKASQTAFGNQAETMDGMHDRLEKLKKRTPVRASLRGRSQRVPGCHRRRGAASRLR